MSVFCRIDHAAGAHEVGVELSAVELLIFGNARSGTRLMQLSPTSAIDLPLRALVWADAASTTWLSYNEPESPGTRAFGFRDESLWAQRFERHAAGNVQGRGRQSGSRQESRIVYARAAFERKRRNEVERVTRWALERRAIAWPILAYMALAARWRVHSCGRGSSRHPTGAVNA